MAKKAPAPAVASVLGLACMMRAEAPPHPELSMSAKMCW